MSLCVPGNRNDEDVFFQLIRLISLDKNLVMSGPIDFITNMYDPACIEHFIVEISICSIVTMSEILIFNSTHILKTSLQN